MEITKVLLSNYLPYAKGTIIGRAIPSIDGFKPVQRRVIYSMYKAGLLQGKKSKSSTNVGRIMQLHPHGDMSIYESMVRMAEGNESLNVPYIESKGNFGKVYSKDLAFAAPRYTEVKLAEICKELLEGIEENAVDMINNFDDTTIEPTLLPVKFPTILVNPSSGIAVSTSSNIPSFALKNVCDATIGILDGSIGDAERLMEVLGVPEFTTGGHVHASKEDLIELGKSGRGSFIVSGTVTTYPDRIVIHEIPYRTTAEDIIEDIEEYAKSGELKEVSNVSDEIDLNGFKLVVKLKRGSNPREVLAKLCRYTNLRMKMSFITRVIINDRCEELGLYSLLEHWINFRMQTITRIYQYKCDKAKQREHLLEAWEKIKDDVRAVANLIANTNEDDAREQLAHRYGMTEEQLNYLLDMRIRSLTQDNLKKRLGELANVREDVVGYISVVNNDDVKKKMIIEELTKIRDRYGAERKTQHADPIVETDEFKKEEIVDDTLVRVILTKSGYLKRLATLRDIETYELPEGEEVKKIWNIRNNEYILVFTYSGECHKILVNSIDASRGDLKDRLLRLLSLPDEREILFIDASGDFSGYFNLVYPNGRGTRVYYDRVSGNRMRYRSLFQKGEYGQLWVTKADEFFMITAKRKAAYCDLTLLGKLSNRAAFKVARVGYEDYIFGLQPVENVPDIKKIDIERYNKDYTVNIGEDRLWHTTSE